MKNNPEKTGVVHKIVIFPSELNLYKSEVEDIIKVKDLLLRLVGLKN